jgi:hypothetical protein
MTLEMTNIPSVTSIGRVCPDPTFPNLPSTPSSSMEYVQPMGNGGNGGNEGDRGLPLVIDKEADEEVDEKPGKVNHTWTTSSVNSLMGNSRV